MRNPWFLATLVILAIWSAIFLTAKHASAIHARDRTAFALLRLQDRALLVDLVDPAAGAAAYEALMERGQWLVSIPIVQTEEARFTTLAGKAPSDISVRKSLEMLVSSRVASGAIETDVVNTRPLWIGFRKNTERVLILGQDPFNATLVLAEWTPMATQVGGALSTLVLLVTLALQLIERKKNKAPKLAAQVAQ